MTRERNEFDQQASQFGPASVLTPDDQANRIPPLQKFSEEGVRVKTTIRVNRKRPESMTKQITDQLTGLIESGAMTVGSYLPSERELANSLKVARNVVRGSYENLMKAGRIQSEGRKGRTVRTSGGKKRAGAAKTSKTGAKARKK